MTCARSGVIDIEATMASHLRSSRAGMMPSQSVFTISHEAPISAQRALAMSMSKPTTSPAALVSENGG
jgi:hypothetical protein